MKLFLVLSIFVLSWNKSNAQDASVSQFYALPHLSNPALYAIVDNEFTVAALYQNRFADAVSGAYHLTGAQLNVAISVAKGDIVATNISFLSDKMAISGFNRNAFSIGLAYAKSLSNYQTQLLSVGLNTSYNQQHSGFAGVLWGNQFDGINTLNPDIPSGEFVMENGSSFDFNAGLQYFGDFNGKATIYGGVGIFHIFETNSSQIQSESYSRPLRINGNIGFNIPVSKMIGILGSFTFQKQSSLQTITPGLFVSLTLKESKEDGDVRLTLGSYYRLSNFIIPTARIEAKGFSLGMAYDVALPGFDEQYKRFTGPEIFISYGFDVFDGLHKNSSNSLRCPKF
ncbi:MAG: hypothetical protein R2728_05065 [Chitinophagales bacterium]